MPLLDLVVIGSLGFTFYRDKLIHFCYVGAGQGFDIWLVEKEIVSRLKN